ncbi:MAG: phosphatase PAP2 family protein [Betaproteobacteria bacterium]
MDADDTGQLRLSDTRVWLVPAVAVVAAIAILLTGTNERIFLLINRLGPASNDWIWSDLTVLGDTMVALALCLPLARRRPDLLWAVLPAALLATAWVHIYKPILDVTRPPGVLAPDAFHVIGPAHHYHSFPSGHTTTAFALAGLCVFGLNLRAWSAVPLAIAVCVALSRVVVGVHWPLDILAGACGGWLAAAVGLKLSARMHLGQHPFVQWLTAAAFAGCAIALVVGYDAGYADAIWFQRGIGAASLVAFFLTFVSTQKGG